MEKLMSTLEITEKVEALMVKEGYLERTINKYRTCWEMLLLYEQENNISVFSAGTAMTFLESVYGITTFTALSKTDGIRARAIQFLCEFNQYGKCRMLKSRCKNKDKVPHFSRYLEEFKKFQKDKHLISNNTLKNYDKYIGNFLVFT